MIKPLEIRYEVRGYDCGYGGPLKPFALANFFQETAGAHATVLGIGMEDMWARGLTWMLSRIDIRIEAMPGAGQKVIARTWPVGAKKLYAQRCLELLDESGFRYAGECTNISSLMYRLDVWFGPSGHFPSTLQQIILGLSMTFLLA